MTRLDVLRRCLRATHITAAFLKTRQQPHLNHARVESRGRVLSTTEYPETTDQLCWHCCHGFDTRPLPMPVKYDDRRDLFHVIGTFCSWECMKAYNLSSRDYRQDVNAINVSLFRKRCTGSAGPLRSAPPRSMLQAFGGTMTIDEFRSTNKTYSILPPRMVLYSQVIEERSRPHTRSRQRQQDMDTTVDFTNVAVRNETLRLKRPKPLQNTKNLLERTMGINVPT